MKSSSKSKAQTVVVDDATGERSVNDNNPGFIRGHELSDLDGVPRQPAAETVLHYARRTLIDSFPYHPGHAARAPAHVPVMDALPEKVHRHARSARAHVSAACLGSLLFHAALVVVLIATMVAAPDVPQDEAGDTLSVVMLGDSDADQMASGEKSEEPPTPDEVVAEAVQPDVVQPTTSETAEATPDDPVQPVQPAEPMPQTIQPEEVQPTQAVTRVSPETVVSPVPEVLAVQAPMTPDDTAISQPMATEIQPEEMKPAEAPPSETPPMAVQPETVQPTEAVQPVETAEATPPPPPVETVTPVEKPTPPARPKPKEAAKKPPLKPVKVKSGSEGENERNSTIGSADGTEMAKSDTKSAADGRRQGSGDAAEANYLGRVQSRLERCIQRLPSEYKKSGASSSARLVSDANGNVVAVSILRNSGVPGLDGAIASAIRSCDLPALPDEYGARTRTMTVPVDVR